MQLVGMLDSPDVRRVAISFQLLGLSFEHRSLSVFRNVDQFRAIHPLIKAPTLVCDDGQVQHQRIGSGSGPDPEGRWSQGTDR